MKERSHSRLKSITEQFLYKLLLYESVNPIIKICVFVIIYVHICTNQRICVFAHVSVSVSVSVFVNMYICVSVKIDL